MRTAVLAIVAFTRFSIRWKPEGYVLHNNEGLAAHWCLLASTVTNYTARWQRHNCVSNMPRYVTCSSEAGEIEPMTLDLQCYNHYITIPHCPLLPNGYQIHVTW